MQGQRLHMAQVALQHQHMPAGRPVAETGGIWGGVHPPVSQSPSAAIEGSNAECWACLQSAVTAVLNV